MSDRELMRNISDSYDDFVNTMVRWMEKDSSIRTKILDFMKERPNSSTSDLLGVLWECIGIDISEDIADDGCAAKIW